MKRLGFSFAVALFFLTMSSSALALSSTCGSNATVRIASHVVNLNWYESVISNVLEWESEVDGPVTRTLEDSYANAAFVALHVFFSLPYGSYDLTGVARLYAYELGEWEQFSGSRCFIVFDIREPEDCPGDPVISNEVSLRLETERDLQNSIRNKVGRWPIECTSEGAISVSGEIGSFDMSQECCDVTRYSQLYEGEVQINLSGISCSVESPGVFIWQLASSVTLKFSLGVGGGGGILANAPSEICEDNRLSTISANFSGTASLSASGIFSVAPPLDLVRGSVTGTGSARFSLTLSAANLLSVDASGCLGPVSVTGSYSITFRSISTPFEGSFRSWSIPNSSVCFSQ